MRAIVFCFAVAACVGHARRVGGGTRRTHSRLQLSELGLSRSFELAERSWARRPGALQAAKALAVFLQSFKPLAGTHVAPRSAFSWQARPKAGYALQRAQPRRVQWPVHAGGDGLAGGELNDPRPSLPFKGETLDGSEVAPMETLQKFSELWDREEYQDAMNFVNESVSLKVAFHRKGFIELFHDNVGKRLKDYKDTFSFSFPSAWRVLNFSTGSMTVERQGTITIKPLNWVTSSGVNYLMNGNKPPDYIASQSHVDKLVDGTIPANLWMKLMPATNSTGKKSWMISECWVVNLGVERA